MDFKVTALIPAYNRERNIGEVLGVLIRSKHVDEVLCVYDGFDAKTFSIINSFKSVKLTHSKKRQGKAYAVGRGIRKAKGDIILLIDADIQGLTEKTVRQLINPLQSGKYDAVLGYRCSKAEATVGVPLGGERAYFRKDLIKHIRHFEKKGYGLELYLNYHFKNKRKKIVRLHGVYSKAKHHKYPYATATKMYAGETYQVIKEMVNQQNLFSYFYRSYLSYVLINNQRLDKYFQEARSFITEDVIGPFKD